MKFQTVEILTAGDPSGNLTSDVLDIRLNYGVFIQAKYTGSPTGDIALEASNDQVTWTQIDKVTISGSSNFINKDAIYAPYVRVHKLAGGTGSVTVSATIKGV